MQTMGSARNSHILSDGPLDGAVSSSKKANGYATIPISFSSSLSSPSSFSPSGVKFIEHRVSKMDTLAGIAIKYGVEVADIKRINGLVTDIQMFAHNSLQIPLPGKHPPSHVMSNCSTQNGEKKTPPRRRSHYDILNSLQSLDSKPPSLRNSPAMCSLQGFYGLTQPEMAIAILPENKKPSESPIFSDPTLTRHRKSRSFANVTSLENGDRRRRKAEAEPPLRAPPAAIPLEEEGGGGAWSGRAGEGAALRPKPGSRMDSEVSRRSSLLVSVPKSFSASNLSESQSISSAIWPAGRWSLKPDAAIARPIFDGLPKPVIAWRNKAALD